MSALTAVMMTLKKDAESKLIAGSVHFASAGADWAGHRLVACAELTHQRFGRRNHARTFWRIDGKRVAAAKIPSQLGEG